MPRSNFKNLLPISLALPIVGMLSYKIVDAYKLSTTPSAFEKAASELGFNGYTNSQQTISREAEQEALLKILQISGYLDPKNLWQDINRIGKLKDPEAVFKSIYPVLIKARVNAGPTEFNAKYLRKNLFNNATLDQQDVKDLTLYLAQHAFNRKLGEERSELKTFDWMNEYKVDYFKAAKNLGLVDRIYPNFKEYDAAWIAGASRIGVLARIIDYKYILSLGNNSVNGTTSVLAGERELWAEIDGINPKSYEQLLDLYKNDSNIDNSNIHLATSSDPERDEEGMQYMSRLAQENQIPLQPTQPFIKYNSVEEAIKGRFAGRTYANYVAEAKLKLTETLMTKDLLQNFLGNEHNIHIVDTLSENQKRPDTATTARDAAENFITDIKLGKYGARKEFKILLQTNNPYIERQALVTQVEVNKALSNSGLDKEGYKITIDGVGFSNRQDVTTIHSEFGALVAEKWKLAHANDVQQNIELKRNIDDMLFQKRDNSSAIPDMPEISQINLYGNLLKDLFDNYLD
ncbi:MAG: hypothetical protein K0Q51_934 [Rickettsiaceae bacterium]|jgi:hypothetical protein|nr:hypothetical protein [Rickettsiaceae bacterium]